MMLSTMKDHPRVCGEKAPRRRNIQLPMGSPPRMRGKGNVDSIKLLLTRITPAYAGKRYTNGAAFKIAKDHPRVCGEKYPTANRASDAIGSPPRMRGKVSLSSIKYDTGRITPAYAGKRLKRSTITPLCFLIKLNFL